jgi:hypothetical protein
MLGRFIVTEPIGDLDDAQLAARLRGTTRSGGVAGMKQAAREARIS